MRNHAFHFAVHGGDPYREHPFTHAYTDAAHAVAIGREMSLCLPEGQTLSVGSCARYWLRFDHGVEVTRRKWSDFYTSTEESKEDEHDVAYLLQTADRPYRP